jgi:hypothetical protein
MFRSRIFSFGVVAALLLANGVCLAPRHAVAAGEHVVIGTSWAILYYQNPRTGETGTYGRYKYTLYNDGRFDTGGADAAYAELVSVYHIPPDHIWFGAKSPN